MGKFFKIASEELFSSGMEDRYKDPEEDSLPDIDIGFSPKYKEYLNKVTYHKSQPTPKGKFFTAKPSSTAVNPTQFKYKDFSKKTDFATIAPYIIQAESSGKYYKSKKPNTDGTVDYGFFQINTNNLDRKTSGWKLADKFDPIFKKYHDYYTKNLSGKTIDGITYEPLKGDSLDVDTRKQLLQVKHKKFNSYGPSLSWDLSEQIYNQRGIDQWSTRDKVIAMHNEGKNDMNSVAMND